MGWWCVGEGMEEQQVCREGVAQKGWGERQAWRERGQILRDLLFFLLFFLIPIIIEGIKECE